MDFCLYLILMLLKLIKCGVESNSNIRRHLANAHGLVQLKAKSHPSRSVVTFDPFRKKNSMKQLFVVSYVTAVRSESFGGRVWRLS